MPDATSLDLVGQIFHVIPDRATPPQVRDALRTILGDAQLELYWWDRDREVYVDGDGEEAIPAAGPGRVLTPVAYESRRVGALVHAPEVLELPDFLSTFVPAMRIAMERDRLAVDLLRTIDDLRASRLRIVEAGDRARRRLERNLHDGAQQRLTAVLLGLRALEARAGDDLRPLVTSLREELEDGLADLRELARGLHPPLLAERGLAEALRAAAARSPLPVDLDLRVADGIPPAVEAAAYYVCAEAAANAVRYASAARLSVTVVQGPDLLVVDVADDGRGGAEPSAGEGTGLRGLRDRVEALGGTLTLESPPGEGTRLVAAFPLGPSA